MSKRDKKDPLDQPISVYEMHLGSWMHASTDDPFINSNGEYRTPVPAADMKPGSRFLTYKELAEKAMSRGIELENVLGLPILEDIGRSKFEENMADLLDKYDKTMTKEFSKIMEGA